MAYVKASERRRQLVSAARVVLVRDGVASTTLRSVAAEAGVPLGTLHYVFSSKELLLTAVFEDVRDEVSAVLNDVAEKDAGLELAIRHGLKTFWEQQIVGDPRLPLMRQELFLYAVRTPGLEDLARLAGRGLRADRGRVVPGRSKQRRRSSARCPSRPSRARSSAGRWGSRCTTSATRTRLAHSKTWRPSPRWWSASRPCGRPPGSHVAASDRSCTFASRVTDHRGCLVSGVIGNFGMEERDEMRVFVAGGTGVVGRRVVPQLVARGHQVTATTTSAGRSGAAAGAGRRGRRDGRAGRGVGRRGRRVGAAGRHRARDDRHSPATLDLAHMDRVVRPDHPAAHRGHRPPARRRRGDRRLAVRRPELRAAGTAFARAAGSRPRRIRSIRGTGPPAEPGMAAIHHVEDAVLRAGARHCGSVRSTVRGPSTTWPKPVRAPVPARRRRRAATPPWVHLDDAASATVLAVEQKANGVFNIVDDEPAPASEWLPPWPRALARSRRSASRRG